MMSSVSITLLLLVYSVYGEYSSPVSGQYSFPAAGYSVYGEYSFPAAAFGVNCEYSFPTMPMSTALLLLAMVYTIIMVFFLLATVTIVYSKPTMWPLN